MSSELPTVALQIEEPGKEPVLLQFENKKMVKIGRGSRKGIDVQLDDKGVARMHAVVHVRSDSDLFVMDMGSAGGTFVDGKKSGAKGKLQSGSVIKVGETSLTLFVGDDIPTPEPVAPPALPEPVVLSSPVAGNGGLVPPPLPTQAAPSPVDEAKATAEVAAPPAHTSAPPAADTAAQMTMPYNPSYTLHPMQPSPCCTSGVLTPAPAPFPASAGEMGPQLLLEVVERLGRQQWYREEKVW